MLFLFFSLISVSDISGNVLFWSSSGCCGFKGSRKGTPFAAQLSCESVIKRSVEAGIKVLEVIISGVGPGRDTSIRSLQNFNINVLVIKDVTPIPHNGCRSRKKRRI